MLSARDRFLDAEERAWAGYGLSRRQRWVELPAARRRIRVVEHGSGPTVAFFHGITGCSTTWLPILPYIEGYRCLLFDFLCHGASDDYDFAGVRLRPFAVDVITEALDALDVDRCSLVGNSMGGMFSLWLAAARPDRFDSVVAVGEPGAALPGARAKFPFWLLSTPIVNRAIFAVPPPLPVQQAYGRAHRDRPDPRADDLTAAEYWANRQPGRGEAISHLSRTVARTTRVLPEAELRDDEIDTWSVPTRFIWGEGAPLLSPDVARRTIDRMPTAELVVVPGGHNPWADDPPARAALVTDFLAAHAHLDR